MPESSGINLFERSVGGAFTGPGEGRLFFFDTASRGPLIYEDMNLADFEQIYGNSGRAYNLAKAYFGVRLDGIAPPKITFARVVSATATAMTISINDRQTPTPATTLKIDLIGPGVVAGPPQVVVADGRISGTVTITIKVTGARDEVYENVSMNPADTRYAPLLINRGSQLVRATDLNPSNTYATTDNPANGTFNLAGGSNGAALANTDLTAALNRLSLVNRDGILYTPYPNTVVAAAMLAFVGKYAYIDVPTGSAYAAALTFRNNFVSSFGEVIQGEGYIGGVDELNILPLGILKAAGQLIVDAQGGRGPHYSYSYYDVGYSIGFTDAYESDARSSAKDYERAGITHFRRLPGGGTGPVGIYTCSSDQILQYANKRRTRWYFVQQITRILTPFLHKRLTNPETIREIDSSVAAFFTGIVEPRGMVVGPNGGPGPRGSGWQWQADGNTTPQALLDQGKLIARLGERIPTPLNSIDLDLGGTDFLLSAGGVEATETTGGEA